MAALDEWLDQHRRAVHAGLVLAPILIGAYPITGLINPLWGSLFGFPLHWAAQGHGVGGPHPWTETFAFLVWPIIMIALMAWVAGLLVAWASPWRRWLILVWAVSALAVVPFDVAMTRFTDWPLYGAFE